MSQMRLISIMALALISVLALMAPQASASHDDDSMGPVACTLVPGGVSGQAEKGGEDGVNSFAWDEGSGGGWDPLQLMDTDPGHFNFEGSAVCAGGDVASESDSKAGPEAFGPVVVDITASGDYDNLMCGTGTANGDAAVFAPAGLNNPEILIFTEFEITFAGGVGSLVFVVDADETGDPDERTDPGGQYPTAPDGAENWDGAAMVGDDPAPPATPTYFTAPGHSHVGDNQIDGGGGNGVIDIAANGGHCIEPGGKDGNVRQFLVNGSFGGVLSGEGESDSDDSEPTQVGDSDL